MDSFDRFWAELEKEKLLGLDPETFRKVLATLVSEFNLALKSIEETERKDLVVGSSDRLGKDVETLVRIDEENQGIDKDDVEDFYSDMVERGALNAIFFTNSYFTKGAKEFATGLPLRLVDRQELSNLVYDAQAVRLRKAFISEIDDAHVSRYFKERLKVKLTSLFLRRPDRIQEIDRRYLPIGFFSLRQVSGETEKRKYAYIDLSTGDLYYIDEGQLKKNDLIRQILELTAESRHQLLELVNQGDLPYDNLEGKNLSILMKNNLVGIYDRKRHGNGFAGEVESFISFFVAEIAEFVGIKRGGYGTVPETPAKKFVGANLRMPSLEHPFDLEHFMETSSAQEEFDADLEKYKPEEVASLLKDLTGAAEVKFNYIIYMPYYMAKYKGLRGVSYERVSSPKFKPFFPKPGTYTFLYHVIDKFPDFPYLVIAFFYMSANMNQAPKLLHVFASTLLFIALAIIVGITLKAIFRTERNTPFYATHDYGIPVFRYGFPSLHSLAATGAVTFSYFIDPMGPLVSVLMMPIAAAYIYSRIRIGAHNQTDVIGGAIVGFFVGLFSGMIILSMHLPLFIEVMLALLMVAGLVFSIIARIRYMY